jgi:hypothetical protein
VAAVDAALKNVRAIDERIADIRQSVWTQSDDDEAGTRPST